MIKPLNNILVDARGWGTLSVKVQGGDKFFTDILREVIRFSKKFGFQPKDSHIAISMKQKHVGSPYLKK